MSEILSEVKSELKITFLKGNYSDRAIINLMSKYKVQDVPDFSIAFFKTFGRHLQTTLAYRNIEECELEEWIRELKTHPDDLSKD